MKIGIIGGGASGLVCAIVAKNKDNEVIILERNEECGKKILATGNGRCNYWNEDQSIKHYSSSTDYLIKELINEETEEDVMSFFDQLGIIPKIKNGYYYPKSNQALSIRNVFVEEAKEKGVQIFTNYLVKSIEKKEDKFIVNHELEFDKLVLATGSCAAPKTGSDGMGYDFLKKMHHTIIKPFPALVQLNTKPYPFLKKWKGIRSDVRVFLLEEKNSLEKIDKVKLKGKVTIQENNELLVYSYQEGEIQLTDYGISGICVMNLSNQIGRRLEKEKSVIVEIDFLKDFDTSTYLKRNKTVKRLLDCLLNNKLVNILLEEAKVDKNSFFSDLEEEKQQKLLQTIHRFRVEVTSTKSFEEAQVASGGVSLEEINLWRMESKIIKNFYIIGELIDLTGECGGYNLGICFRSAINAGVAVRGDFDD